MDERGEGDNKTELEVKEAWRSRYHAYMEDAEDEYDARTGRGVPIADATDIVVRGILFRVVYSLPHDSFWKSE